MTTDSRAALLERLTGPAALDVPTFARALDLARAGDEPLLRALLARRQGLDASLAPDHARAVERAVIEHVTRSHAALARLAPALQARWPEALAHPRVLGAIHVALEVDALSPRELFSLLQPLLAVEDRWALFGDAPLLARIRAANVCRGVARAHGLVGALDAVVGFEHEERFLVVLGALYRDVDPAVGVRAAWAVGALRADPRVAELAAAPGTKATAGLSARRALVADVARWQLGELTEATLSAQLHDGLGRSDPYARAAALLAMSHGAELTTSASRALVASFAGDPSPVVRAAVGAFAADLPDELAHTSLLDALRAGTTRPGDPVALRIWTEPHPFTSALHAMRAARAAARGGALEARGEVTRALDALAGLEGREPEPLSEAVRDHTLLSTPLLHDLAAAAGDETLVEGCRARVAAIWTQRAARALDTRAASKGSPDEIRGLRRALDLLPHGPSADPEPRLALACALFARLAESEGELTRPLASALVAATEPLARDGQLASADVLLAALGLGSARVLGALAGAAASGPTAEGLGALADLRAALDRGRRPGPRMGRDPAGELLGHLEGVLRAAELLTGSPRGARLHAALLALHAASLATSTRAEATLELWREAHAGLSALRAGGSEAGPLARRVTGEPQGRTHGEAEIAQLLLALLAAAGLATPPEGRSLTSSAKASKRWNATLPAALAGILDALLAAPARPASPEPTATRGPVYVGKVIGDYLVVRVLGSGAMGHCVLVRRRLETGRDARRWVLKLPQRADLVGLFRDEALALIQLSELRHPGIVRFTSFVDYGARLPFLVMDYIEGESLEHRIARAPIEAGEARMIAHRLASALATSHGMGICHYDLKPANVVLGDAGPVIVDWGLAGAAAPDAGTPEYMAPERFDPDGPRPSDRARAVTTPHSARGGVRPETGSGAADVFALGCLLGEMAGGAPLVTADLVGDEATTHPRLHEALALVAEPLRRSYGCAAVVRTPTLLRGRAERALARLDARFRDVALACLEPDPAQRPSAAEVARRLAITPADT